MATDHLSTSITVGFDKDSGDKKGQLKITNDYGTRYGHEYRFRIWPAVSATVVTNNGIVYPIPNGGPYSVTGQEYVTFSNSDTATTDYPMVEVLGASVAGGALDSEGQPVGISFTFENGELKASQPFYGGAVVSYVSSYYIWGWAPVITGSAWWNRSQTSFDYAIQILAFYEGASATHEVSYGSVEVNDYMEAYKVTSEYIADKDGQWELPPNWPTDNEYPADNEEGPNLKAFQKLKRTHEILTVSYSGVTSLDRQHVTWLKPYTNSNLSYDPVYSYQKGTARDGFESVFLDLNWSSIESSVQSRYPGITI